MDETQVTCAQCATVMNLETDEADAMAARPTPLCVSCSLGIERRIECPVHSWCEGHLVFNNLRVEDQPHLGALRSLTYTKAPGIIETANPPEFTFERFQDADSTEDGLILSATIDVEIKPNDAPLIADWFRLIADEIVEEGRKLAGA